MYRPRPSSPPPQSQRAKRIVPRGSRLGPLRLWHVAEAVAYVREHYDLRAVETPCQRRYVARFIAS